MVEKITIQTEEVTTDTHTISPGEVIIGELAGVDEAGRPMVNFAGVDTSESVLALTTQEVTRKHIGRQVALLFANGDKSKPVIVGLIHNPLSDMLENFSEQQMNNDTPFPEVSKEYADLADLKLGEEEQVLVDGKKVTIEGAEEITLKCGKASITLTKSGKILLRGTYLSNRSSGVNRILGGSVQIN